MESLILSAFKSTGLAGGIAAMIIAVFIGSLKILDHYSNKEQNHEDD